MPGVMVTTRTPSRGCDDGGEPDEGDGELAGKLINSPFGLSIWGAGELVVSEGDKVLGGEAFRFEKSAANNS